MAALVHFSLLLLLPAATLVAVLRTRFRPTALRVFLGIVGALTCAALSLLLSLHMCSCGQPVTQWAIPSLCIAVGAILVSAPWARRALMISAFLLSIGLSFHYAAIVHGPDYVGAPRFTGHAGIENSEFEWHTWLTGLYRRSL